MRGGKGVATFLGVLIVLLPVAAAIYAAVWVLALLTIRISSVAGMAAAVSAPLTAAALSDDDIFPMLLGFALLVLWKHRANIDPPQGGDRASRRERERLSGDLVDRLRLVRSPGIGPITYRQLVARFGSASEALAAVPDLARRGGGNAPRLWSRDAAEREIAQVEKLGARYLCLGQGLYPRLLAEQEDAPPLLIAKGVLNLLDRPLVAIVGARNASAAACRFARGLAHELGAAGHGGRVRSGAGDRQRGA